MHIKIVEREWFSSPSNEIFNFAAPLPVVEDNATIDTNCSLGRIEISAKRLRAIGSEFLGAINIPIESLVTNNPGRAQNLIHQTYNLTEENNGVTL